MLTEIYVEIPDKDGFYSTHQSVRVTSMKTFLEMVNQYDSLVVNDIIPGDSYVQVFTIRSEQNAAEIMP